MTQGLLCPGADLLQDEDLKLQGQDRQELLFFPAVLKQLLSLQKEDFFQRLLFRLLLELFVTCYNHIIFIVKSEIKKAF